MHPLKKEIVLHIFVRQHLVSQNHFMKLFWQTLEKASGLEVQKGEFGADMLVEIQNDGPITIIMDTEDKK